MNSSYPRPMFHGVKQLLIKELIAAGATDAEALSTSRMLEVNCVHFRYLSDLFLYPNLWLKEIKGMGKRLVYISRIKQAILAEADRRPRMTDSTGQIRINITQQQRAFLSMCGYESIEEAAQVYFDHAIPSLTKNL